MLALWNPRGILESKLYGEFSKLGSLFRSPKKHGTLVTSYDKDPKSDPNLENYPFKHQ